MWLILKFYLVSIHLIFLPHNRVSLFKVSRYHIFIYLINSLNFQTFSIFLSVMTSVCCFVGCTFTSIHLLCLSIMICQSYSHTNSSCYCALKNTYSNNRSFIPIKKYHYIDMHCNEVKSIFAAVLIISSSLNFIAGLVSIWYVYLYWSSRYKYTHSKPWQEKSPTIIINVQTHWLCDLCSILLYQN